MSKTGSLILSIDTTSRLGSLAVARDGRVGAVAPLDPESQQSAILWSEIDRILAPLGATPGDVTAWAVARGPGAFTGVRVGIAAAAGLARATNRPLYGATSLELAARAAGPGDPVWVVLNAYRNEVYAQLFAVGSTVEPLGEPLVEAPAALFARFEEGPMRVVGSGVDAYREALDAEARRRGAAPAEALWRAARGPELLAGELAALVGAWVAEGREPGLVEPCYVRPSEAEINLRAGKLAGAGAPRSA